MAPYCCSECSFKTTNSRKEELRKCIVLRRKKSMTTKILKMILLRISVGKNSFVGIHWETLKLSLEIEQSPSTNGNDPQVVNKIFQTKNDHKIMSPFNQMFTPSNLLPSSGTLFIPNQRFGPRNKQISSIERRSRKRLWAWIQTHGPRQAKKKRFDFGHPKKKRMVTIPLNEKTSKIFDEG